MVQKEKERKAKTQSLVYGSVPKGNVWWFVGHCWKLVTVTVVLLLSDLLRSRGVTRDRLRQPLSPLYIVFPLPSLLRCFPLLLFFNLALGQSSNTSCSPSFSLCWIPWYRSLRLPTPIPNTSQQSLNTVSMMIFCLSCCFKSQFHVTLYPSAALVGGRLDCRSFHANRFRQICL